MKHISPPCTEVCVLKGQPTFITVQTHLGQHDMTHVVQLLPDLGGTHVLLLQYPHHTKAQVQELCAHATSNIANSTRGTCIVHELAGNHGREPIK